MAFMHSWPLCTVDHKAELTFRHSWLLSTDDIYKQLTFMYSWSLCTVDIYVQLTYMHSWNLCWVDLYQELNFIYSWPLYTALFKYKIKQHHLQNYNSEKFTKTVVYVPLIIQLIIITLFQVFAFKIIIRIIARILTGMMIVYKPDMSYLRIINPSLNRWKQLN